MVLSKIYDFLDRPYARIFKENVVRFAKIYCLLNGSPKPPSHTPINAGTGNLYCLFSTIVLEVF